MKKILIAIFSLVFISSAFLGVFFLNKKKNNFHKECYVQEKKYIVNGISMSGIFENGEEVIALHGYYACQPIERGEVVIVQYSGNKNNLLKIVKAVPGDKFELRKNENNRHNLFINGEIQKNSIGQDYVFSEKAFAILNLYAKDYKNIIPENSYLILGNLAEGSVDSTRFGLIDKSAILAPARKK